MAPETTGRNVNRPEVAIDFLFANHGYFAEIPVLSCCCRKPGQCLLLCFVRPVAGVSVIIGRLFYYYACLYLEYRTGLNCFCSVKPDKYEYLFRNILDQNQKIMTTRGEKRLEPQLLEKIVPLVINEYESREILDLYLPYSLHSKLGKIYALDLPDVFFSQHGRRPTY